MAGSAKVKWVRAKLSKRLKGVSSVAKRKALFRSTWKEAHKKFGR